MCIRDRWGTIGLAFFAGDRGIFTGDVTEGFKLLGIQIIIALVSMVFAGVITLVIALAIKYTMGWRVTREEEFEGVDYSVHRETGYDFGGPGMRPGGLPAGNKSAAELGLNEARGDHHNTQHPRGDDDAAASRKIEPKV